MSTPTKSQSMNEDFPMTITENEDGTITIEWDENHPVTSIFNTWNQDDFINAIDIGCTKILGQEECDRIEEEHSNQK